ncbi:MAG: radical SAM protein [Acidimicrobiia bacterium]
MKVLLVSAYELGHQPVAVAGPAGRLRARGHEVRCLDLSIDPWDPALGEWADKVAVSVPMHTAARLARQVAPTITAPVACYGLYAAMCADVATALVSRDPDTELVRWIEDDPALGDEPALPARDLLPPLERYTHLVQAGEEHLVASVAASRGCAHRCRHCPVPVVYDGRIRINDVDDVVADVAQQVAMGARHVTYGDPDFFNGVHHALRVVRAVHARFPDLTFDCTVKVEHILQHPDAWEELAAAGCIFVVSAFESVNDTTLELLDKGHTAEDAGRAVALLRRHGIAIRPSWLPFTPWATLDDVRAILEFVAAHDLVGNVDPVQYTIRLLVPEGSLLLGHIDGLGPWDAERLTYPWTSALDPLQARFAALVEAAGDAPIPVVYDALRAEVGLAPLGLTDLTPAPRLDEPWFCCAEPTELQLRAI